MNAGQVFIIFGELKSTWTANFVVSELDGKNGFIANGVSEGDRAGTSVGGGVDLSGDDFPDLLIGAPKAMGTGVVYVIYGGPSHWNPSIELSSVNGSIPGLVISGSAGSATGYSVVATEGVNGIKNDLLVGAPTASTGGISFNGQAFLSFSEPVSSDNGHGFDFTLGIVIGVAGSIGVVVVLVFVTFCHLRKKEEKQEESESRAGISRVDSVADYTRLQ